MTYVSYDYPDLEEEMYRRSQRKMISRCYHAYKFRQNVKKLMWIVRFSKVMNELVVLPEVGIEYFEAKKRFESNKIEFLQPIQKVNQQNDFEC